MKCMKLTFSVILVVTFAIAASIPADALLSNLTVEQVSWSPKQPQPDDTMSFSVNMKNTLSSEIRIKKIGVHFDWQPQNDYYYEDHTSSPLVIPAQSTWTFSFPVLLPANLTYTSHSYHFKVDYQVGASSYSEKSDNYYDFVLVKYVPPKEQLVWQNPLFIMTIILVVVMVIVIAAFYIVRKRRLAEELARRPLGMRSAVRADGTPEDCELAQTVTKQKAPHNVSQQGARPWSTPPDQRITGQSSKPPIYKFLGPGKGKEENSSPPQQMPQAPPAARPSTQMPQQPPASQPSGPPTQMPSRPPPQVMPQAPPHGMPGSPPPLPPQVPKDQSMLHQCPICGKMNKATDTTCPRCGGQL